MPLKLLCITDIPESDDEPAGFRTVDVLYMNASDAGELPDGSIFSITVDSDMPFGLRACVVSEDGSACTDNDITDELLRAAEERASVNPVFFGSLCNPCDDVGVVYNSERSYAEQNFYCSSVIVVDGETVHCPGTASSVM